MEKPKAFVESLDNVPETHRDFYSEIEGGGGFFFDLDPSEGWANEHVQGLRDTVRKKKQAAEDLPKLQEQLETYTALGSPDEIREAIEVRKKLGEDYISSGDAKEAKEAFAAELKAEHKRVLDKMTADLGARDQTIQSLTGEVDNMLIDSDVRRLMVENPELRGNPDRVIEHLRSIGPHGKRRAQILREKGKTPRVVILDDTDGQAKMTSKNGSTSDMTIDEYIGSLKTRPDWRGVFFTVKADGSGVDPDATSTDGGSTGHYVQITRDQARDHRTYKAARERAQKEGKSLRVV